jgi:hypothetical protein
MVLNTQSKIALMTVGAVLVTGAWRVLPVFALDTCDTPKSCVVVGAETDDAATAKARATVGTGPAAGLAADRRMQTELTEVGQLENGLKIYSFRNLWEDQVRVGVVAQDVLEKAETKKAVLTLANGLLGVDYAALGLRIATLQQWNDSGIAALKADYVFKPARNAKLDEPVRLFNQRTQP